MDSFFCYLHSAIKLSRELFFFYFGVYLVLYNFITSVVSCIYDYNYDNEQFCHCKDHSHLIVLAPFVEKAILFPLNCFYMLVKNQLSILVGLFLGLLFCCIHLCVCPSTSITVFGLL